MRLFKELILGKNKKHQKKADVDFGSLPSLLTIDQVSKIFGVHPNTLRNWDKSGKLTAIRIGVRKDRRYEKDTVIKFYEGLDHLKNKSPDNSQLSFKDKKGETNNDLPEPEVSAYVIKPGLSWSKIKLLLISKRFSVFVYSVSLVAFAFLTIQVTFFTYVYIAQAEANGPQIFILPIQPRESSGWENAKQAINIDLLSTSDLAVFDKENSAFFINQPSVDIEEKNQDNTEPFATTESILEVGDFSAVDSIPKESTITETKIVVSYAIDSFKGNEDVLTFSYSVDDGSTWKVFDSFAISEKESNFLNEGYLEYTLDDIELPEDLEGVRVKIEYNQVPSEEISIVYIDGINIYTTIQEPDEKINEEIVNSITVENKDLKIDEEPVLAVEVEEESALSFLGVDPKQREIKDIIITNPAGEEIEGNVTIDTKEIGRLKIDEYKVNKDNFTKPGAYHVTFVVEQDGYSKKITEEFNWGVLAVNMRNSIGSPNTYTEVGMAVLDNEGRADCQASIDVSIEHPNGLIEQFSSEDGTVVTNPKCIERNVTDQADYTVYFTTTDSGQYKITIEAETKNGSRTIEEIYEVSDSILFNVTRSTFPTRINPVWEYPVTFDVTVQEDYSGQIIETVPNDFKISNISNKGKKITGNNDSITKKIIWDVDWKAGETYNLGYTFDPPDLRRQFYALGPITADQQSEARQWQMVLEGGDQFIEDLPLIVKNGKGKTVSVIKKEKINDENLKTDIIDENYQTGINQKIILPKSGFVNNIKICKEEVGLEECNRWEELDVDFINNGNNIEFETSEVGMIAAFNDEESGNVKIIKQQYEQVNKMIEETELRQPDTITYKKNNNENIKIQSSSYLNYFDGVKYLPLPEIAPPGEILVVKKPVDNKVLYVEVPEWAVIDLSADKKTAKVKDKAGTEIWRYELPYFFDPEVRPYPFLPVLNENLTEAELLEAYPDGIITGLPEEESGILRECTEKSCVIESKSTATIFQVIDNKIYANVPSGLSYPQILVDATDTASTNNKDSHMRKSLATRGYGTCTYLHAGKIISTTYDYRPIFEWTLSSGTGTITDIDLDLYRYNVTTYSGGNSATTRYLELHETTQTATEGSTCDATGATGVTWNTYDGTNSWTTAGGDMSATIVDEVGVSGDGTADAWYTWGLVGTNATNPISGLTWGSTFDFLIYNPDSYSTAGNNLDYFYSKEYTGTTYDPYITITYSTGTTISGTSNTTGTVKVAVNGTLQTASATISANAWSLNTDSALTTGDTVTAFIDGATTANESTAVTEYDGTGSVTGMVLNSNILSVGSDDSGVTLTVTQLGQYDNDNDEDIMHSANTSVLTVDASNVYADDTIDILAADTLTIGGTETLTAHNVTINGSLTSGGASTYNVSGSWDNNSDFNTSTETINFSSTTTETIDSTGAIDYDVDNITFDGVGGQWTLTTALTANGNLTLSNGTLVLGSLTHTVGGNLDLGGGTVTVGSSTITMTGTANTITGGGKTLNNLTIDPATAGTITLQTSDIAVSGILDVATGDVLSISSGLTTTVNSTGTLTLSGTISGAGRLTYKPAAAFPTTGSISSILRFDTADNNQTLGARGLFSPYGGDVEIYNATTTNRTVTMAAGSPWFSDNLYLIGDSTGTITLDGSVNNPSPYITSNLDFTGTGGGTEEIINSGTGQWSVSGNIDFRNGTYTATVGNELLMTTGASFSIWSGGNALYNFSTSSGGTITANDAMIVNGDFTNGSGNTFIAPSSLTLKGNYTNNGDFTHSNGTVTLAGTGTQTLAGQMTGASDKLYNLTITNATALITFSDGAETANNYTITTAGVTVTYTAGQTYTFQNINWTGATGLGNEITFQSSTTSVYNMAVNGTQTDVSYVDVAYSDACTGNNWIDASNGTNTDSGNNDCWMFSSITVSGTLLDSGELLGYNCGTDNVTLHVAQRGARSGTATCTSLGGAYSITVAAPTGTGDSLAVYADSGEPTFQGTTVTTAADAISNITGLDLIDNNVVVRHEDAGPISNSDLSAVDDGDAGIRYAVSGTTINIDSTINLHVNSGDTYDPNGSFTTSGGGQFHLDNNATATADTIGSSSGGNTVVDTGATLNIATAYSSSSDILVEGTIQGTASITVNGGDFTGDGVVNMTGGDVTFPIAGTIGGNTNWTFFDLSFTQATCINYTTTALGTGNMTVTNTLIGDFCLDIFTLMHKHILDPGSKLWILSGTGNPMDIDRTFIGDGSSTFRYTGSGANVTIDDGSYSTLELSPTSSTTYQHLSLHTVTLKSNLTINSNVVFDAGNSNYSLSGSATTIDANGAAFYNLTVGSASSTNTHTVSNTDFSVTNILDVDIDDTLAIPTGRNVTLTNTGSLTLDNVISGAGQLTYQPAAAFPTTGTISSKLRFDSTNNDQTMSARTYGGDVEVYNNSGVSARTVTMDTGVHSLLSNLYLNAANTQNVSLSGSTNNPTVNITGNLDFTGAGGGSEAISSGTGTWTVSGNVDFTGGTYSPATNNILLMDGAAAGLTTSQALYNFQTGGSGTITLNSNLTTTGDITIGNGSTLSSANNITVNGGNLTTPSGTGTGILNHTAGTVSLSTTGNVGGNGNWTFYNLTLTQASCTNMTTTSTGSGSMTITNILTTDSCFFGDTLFHRLDGGAKTWILTNAGTPFVNNGGFSGDTSIFRYTGAGDTNIVNGKKGISTGYYNLELKPSGGINPTYTIADATINSLNNITIGDGTNDVIVSGTVNNPAVTIGNNISCTTGASTNTVNTGIGTWTVSGNVDLTNCDTWTATTSHTLVMDGTSKTITSGGKSLYNYTVSAGSSVLQDALVVNGNIVISGGSLDTKSGVNNNITVAGNWTNSATFTPRLGTVTFNGGSATASTFVIDSTGAVVDDFYNVVFNDAGDGDTFQLGSAFDVNGNLTITGGALDTTLASSYPITLAGNWTNNDIFYSQVGTVTADGTTTQTFSGTMTGFSKFYNLTVTNAGASNPDIIFATNAEVNNTFSANTGNTQLQFNAGSTYTFNNVNFNGTAGNLVTLRSSSPGTQWNLTSLGTQAVTYTDVQDSYACGGDTIDASGGTNVNSQNNDCWIFVAMSVSISPNSINLGTLSNTLVSQDGITLTVSTDASNGYSATVYYDHTLTSAGSDTISDTAGGTIVAGTEEFGASSSASGYTIAQWSPTACADTATTSNATALTTSPQTFAGATSSVTNQQTILCLLGSITGLTEAGAYTSTITIVATSLY